jgi:hypothetical protein
MLRPYVHDIGGEGTVSHALKKTTTEFRFRIVSKRNGYETEGRLNATPGYTALEGEVSLDFGTFQFPKPSLPQW